MNKLFKVVFLSIFLISNAFSMNNAFKASFVNDKNEQIDMLGNKNEKKENKDKKNESIEKFVEHEAIIKDFSSSSDNTERVLGKKINCLKDINGAENCPESLVQCNQLLEKDKGTSTLIKKTIYKNKFLKNGEYVCPESYIELDYHNLKEGVCKKDYSYYSYSCSSEDKNEYNLSWKGPLLDTGSDCMGECGLNGCICNNKMPPANNCLRENFGCPFDINQKCSITTSSSKENTLPAIYDGLIYSNTISTKIEKTINLTKICHNGYKLDSDGNCSIEPTKLCPLDSKLQSNGYCLYENTGFYANPFPTCPTGSSFNEVTLKCVSTFDCENGSTKTNFGCVKNYSYFDYSCEKGYSLKEKGKDCLGKCGPDGCICNSENPKNNCSKKYSFEEPNSNYKQERNIEKTIPVGTFNKDMFNKFLNFKSSGFEELTTIETDPDEKNKLCFSNSNKTKDCIIVDKCSFEGSIKENNIKGLKLIDKNTISTLDEKQTIKSTCDLNGNVGWLNRTTGITSIKSEDNKLVFFDSYKDKQLGFIEFLPIISEDNFKEGFTFENDISFKLNKNNYTAIDYVNGNTYFISASPMEENKCKKESLKYNLEQVTKFDNSILEKIYILSGNNFQSLNKDNLTPKCVLKKEGNYSFNTYTKLTKDLKQEKGKKVYSCSPYSCENNFCQKATCQDGYEGEIHAVGDFIPDGACTTKNCDAHKPYGLYCGKSSDSCNTSKDNIFIDNGTCKQAICDKGVFDKTKNKCIETIKETN